MAKYADIVALENKSLSQQVVVLNEMLSQNEQENSTYYHQIDQFKSKLYTANAELLAFKDCKLTLEREQRVRVALQQS